MSERAIYTENLTLPTLPPSFVTSVHMSRLRLAQHGDDDHPAPPPITDR